MKTRKEHDSLGSIEVATEALWGAQTQRSIDNFAIGSECFPEDFIKVFALVKKAAARVNHDLGLLPALQTDLICQVCDEISAGQHADAFPLKVWQTGSGTQTNMNLNEVVANRANEIAGHGRGSKYPVHPNDHVNCSQSSNDIFPTVMHVSVVKRYQQNLLPALKRLTLALATKENAFADCIKVGRTHLMDAAPVTLGQEFGAYVAQLQYATEQLERSVSSLGFLALGGSAVGTGLNTHPEWAERVAQEISGLMGQSFEPAKNTFMALACHDEIVNFHGCLRGLAVALYKIGNDLRWLASGPRCGLNELQLPANEPGSSIMPGKVNPTQIEALTMVVAQVIGNDACVSFAGSQGQLELNVFKPVIIFNTLQSICLLAQAMESFRSNCVQGMRVNEAQIQFNIQRSLMLITALNPVIGYDKAAEAAKRAWEKGISLKEATLELGYLDEGEFDGRVDPKKMLAPNIPV
ncbi:MAG: class II fumarate hydratase [Gammaproteobacteria bacterium]|nr:class II fumarate hydratase [Gammaproteobacteria bacterium]